MGITWLDALRAHFGAFDQHFDLRSLAGGEAEIGLSRRGVLFRLQLDFGFQPLVFPVVLEHPGQGAVGGIVIHARSGSEVGVAAEFVHAHSRSRP